MPSLFGHTAVALALGTAFPRARLPHSFWAPGVTCAVVPDLNSVGFRLGVPYEHLLGHRGLSHSILFAVALALALAITTAARLLRGPAIRRASLFIYLALCGISHGILDACTNGGPEVAFLPGLARVFSSANPRALQPLSI